MELSPFILAVYFFVAPFSRLLIIMYAFISFFVGAALEIALNY